MLPPTASAQRWPSAEAMVMDAEDKEDEEGEEEPESILEMSAWSDGTHGDPTAVREEADTS